MDSMDFHSLGRARAAVHCIKILIGIYLFISSEYDIRVGPVTNGPIGPTLYVMYIQ